MKDYKITDHLRERYVERSIKKFGHLRDCRNRCDKCIDLVYEMNDLLRTNRHQIDKEIRHSLLTSKEDRSYLNNTQFVTHYYETYGYDHQIRFMVNGPIVFVCIEEKNGTKVIPTCLCASRHIGVRHHKFKKAEKVAS